MRISRHVMKTLSENDIKIIYDKCVNLVKRKSYDFFNFKKMKKFEGSCNWTDIEIDPRGEVLSTALHECVHYIYPDYSETMVRYIEKRLINVCSELDMAFFLKIISSKIYKSELQKVILKSKKNTKKGTKKSVTKCKK